MSVHRIASIFPFVNAGPMAVLGRSWPAWSEKDAQHIERQGKDADDHRRQEDAYDHGQCELDG
jgi:hypothetical protein